MLLPLLESLLAQSILEKTNYSVVRCPYLLAVAC